MHEEKIIIEEAGVADISALSELMNELGYITSIHEMNVRFQNILNQKDYKTFVATVDKEIVGMVGLTRNYAYEKNGFYVRVLALVTSHKVRQNGIGKKLMETAENWAREIGADTILLNCGNREERAIAHIFYQKLGYQIKSTGFIKKL